MARITPPSATHVFLVFLLIAAASPPVTSVSYTQLKTVVSLAHSLMKRVANLRASRGDLAGAERARTIAARLEQGLGLGFWKVMWSMGWDYARNYAWRDLNYGELNGAISDMSELLRGLGELTRLESEMEKAAWMGRNYKKVLRISKSMFRRLLAVFGQSGAVRDSVETVQRELMEGELLRDCLELGSNDMKGLVQILKDLASQFYSSGEHGDYSGHEL